MRGFEKLGGITSGVLLTLGAVACSHEQPDTGAEHVPPILAEAECDPAWYDLEKQQKITAAIRHEIGAEDLRIVESPQDFETEPTCSPHAFLMSTENMPISEDACVIAASPFPDYGSPGTYTFSMHLHGPLGNFRIDNLYNGKIGHNEGVALLPVYFSEKTMQDKIVSMREYARKVLEIVCTNTS